MDWASSQWKEGLSPVALQKVNALEGQIEKLQKERQQKQLQFECLELTLGKEKRKVEEEKQQTIRLERELQSLADTCKSLENKQQKLQTEIQIRDTKLNNLEGQLSQAKKQNSRLQQLENDLEDLKYLRDNSKFATKELEEKLKQEQSTIVKQCDAISDLEQTIKTLQEKYSSSERSVLIDVDDKENISLSECTTDGYSTESLRKKILEQDNIIEALRSQLQNVSDNKGNLGFPANNVFQTPVKPKNVISEAPLSEKKSFSIWDNFGSTPAKSNRVTKHINTSSSFDSESDEKVRTLQQKLKQVCQELECQRHNSEAAKNAMEQRLKEKEIALKAEIKQHIQTITDLDRELGELKNKYQQDVIQANKKLDVVSMQLQKSEFSKQQFEKDIKALEIQISNNNLLIQQKEEELKDLHKQKNSSEAVVKNLQSEKRELERTCSNLQTDKKSLNEEIKDLKVKLDGSNNLVKEKETHIQKMKKEQDSALKTNSDLQVKLQNVNKDFTDLQSEKNILDKELQNLEAKFLSSKEDIEILMTEKKNINSLLDLEKSKTGKLEFDITKMKKDILEYQSEIKSREASITSLRTEFDDFKDNSKVQIKNLNDTLSKCQEENSQLKNKILTLTNNETTLKGTVEQMKKENESLSNSVSLKIKECEALDLKIANLDSQLLALQNEGTSKSKTIEALKEEINSVKESYQVQIKNLEGMLSGSQEEALQLKNQIMTYSNNETALKASVEQLKEENKNLSNSVSSKVNECEVLNQKIVELNSVQLILQKESSMKEETIESLNKEITSEKVSYQAQIKNLEDALSREQEENSQLKNQNTMYLNNETALKGNIEQLKKENENLSNSVSSKVKECEALGEKTANLDSQLLILQKENITKSETIEALKGEMKSVKESNQTQIKNFEDTLSRSQEEILQLKNQILTYSNNEIDLKTNVEKLKKENENLSNSISSKIKDCEAFDLKIANLDSQLLTLQTEIGTKSETIEALQKEIKSGKKSHEAQIKNLEVALTRSEEENSKLKDQIVTYSDNETSLKANIEELKTEKENLCNSVSLKVKECKALYLKIANLESQLLTLQKESISKTETIETLKGEIKSVKESYQVQIETLQQTLSESQEEILQLNNQIMTYSNSETVLKASVEQLKEENENLSNSVSSKLKDCDILNLKIENLDSQLLTLQKENTTKSETIEVLKEEIRSMKDSYQSQMQNLDDTLARVQEENSHLKNQIETYSNDETGLKANVEKLKKENENLSNSVSSKVKDCEALDLKIANLDSQLLILEKEINTKNEIIEALKKEMDCIKESYQVKIDELQTDLGFCSTEKASLKIQVEEFSEKELSMFNKLKQLEIESKNMSDVIAQKTREEQKLKTEIEQYKTQILEFESNCNIKEEIISNLESESKTLLDEYNVKIKDLKDALSRAEEENSQLKNQILVHSNNETTLKENSEQLKKEIENLSNSLSSREKECEALDQKIANLDSQLLTLQSESNTKNETIETLKEEIKSLKEPYELEIQTLQQQLSLLEAEKNAFDVHIQKLSSEGELLQEQFKQSQQENVKISNMLHDETEKRLLLEANIDKMQLDFQVLQSELHHEKEILKNTEQEFNEKKELYEKSLSFLEVEKNALIKQLSSSEDVLHEQAKQVESEKIEISNFLKLETEKTQLLESSLNEMKVTVQTLKSELEHKEESVRIIEKQLAEAKEFYDVQLKQLEDVISSIKIENENLTNQIKHYVLNEENCMQNIKEAENEKNTISELLLQEIHKREILENSIEELRRNQETFESQISMKDERISTLSTEIERIIRNHEEEKLSLSGYVQDITSKMLLMQECCNKINMEYKIIEDEIRNVKEDCQILQRSDANDKNIRIKFLNGLLKQLDSIEKQAEAMSKDYEDKISELEHNHGLTKSEILFLQHRIEEIRSAKEIICKNYTEEFELRSQVIADLTSREAELKTIVMDLLIQLSSKDNYIENLKSENEFSTITFQEEKSGFIASLENLKSSLVPIQESLQNLYARNEFLENEIRNLKIKYQESQNKQALDQQIKEEFLCDLLNQLNDIEKSALVTSQNYENQLSDISQTLNDLESKLSHHKDENAILMNEKLSLEEELKLTQAKYLQNEAELKSALLLKEKYSTYLVEDENLEDMKGKEAYNFEQIPTKVIRTINEAKWESLPMVSVCGNRNTSQNAVQKYFSEVHDLFIDASIKFSSLNDGVLRQKEYCRFLVNNHLIDDADVRHMLVILNFFKKFHKRIDCKKPIIKLFKTFENYFIFPQNDYCEEFLQAVKLFTGAEDDSDVNSFFEKTLLINSYRNMYMISKLKKALYPVTNQLNELNIKLKKISVFFDRYKDVHSHISHLPVFVDSTVMIYSHSISHKYLKRKFISSFKNGNLLKDSVSVLNLDNMLHNLILSKVPLILNCAFELNTNKIFLDKSNNSIYLNLICFMLEALISFYKNKRTVISSETAKYLEHFLTLISERKIIEIKDIYSKYRFLLEEISFSLLQDLLNLRNQVTSDMMELSKNSNESHLFCDSIIAEKEEKCNSPISSLKSADNKDINVFENLKKLVFEISKIFSVFHNMFSENLDVTKLQLEITNLSDTFCLCSDCLNEGELKRNNDVNHIPFTPVNLIHCIAELFTSKSNFENEVINMKRLQNDLEEKIAALQKDKLELITTVNELEEKINFTNYKMEKLKSKYAVLEKEYQDINVLLSDANEIQQSQLNSIQLHLDEICKYKRECKDLFNENQNLKNELLIKEQKVSCFEIAIEEKTSESKLLLEKCQECETEITCLNNKISELLNDINNTKENKSCDEETNVFITELQNKIVSLERSNSLLNTTFENVEQELQNLYIKSQAVEDDLQKKLREIDSLQKEIVSWQLKDTEGKNEIAALDIQISDLKENECNLREEIARLQTDEQRLASTINNLTEENKSLVDELDSFKSKFTALSDEYDRVNLLLLESNESNLQLAGKCRKEYNDLFSETEKLKCSLIKKEEQVSYFEKAIEEKISEYNVLNIECWEYKTKVSQLNDTITNLMTDTEKHKEQKVQDEQDKASRIHEIQNKLTSLEKSNKLLNVTLENVEEELQKLYLEKQEVEKKLEEKLQEIENLQKEISSWKLNVAEQKKEISSLEQEITDSKSKESHLKQQIVNLEYAKSSLEKSNTLLSTTVENVNNELQNLCTEKQVVGKRLEEMEKIQQSTEKKYSELLNKHTKLQNDVNVFKNVQKEHQVSILEKNFCIKQKDMTIAQLKEKLLANAEEKKCLEMNLAEVKANLNNELQEKTKLLYDLEKKLNTTLKEKLDFEEQIKILQEEEHIKLKSNELENNSLKSQLEKLLNEKTNLEYTIQMLNEKNMVTDEEANKVICLQEDFNSERENYKKSLTALQDKIEAKEKIISENYLLISEKQQKINELKKEISENVQASKQKFTELLCEKNNLQTEIEMLKLQSNRDQIYECNKESLISGGNDSMSVRNYALCTEKLVNLLSDVISSTECKGESEQSKTDLLSLLSNWKSDSAFLSLEVQENLEHFLKSQLRKQKELEMKLASLTKSIYSFICEIGQYSEATEHQLKSDLDCTASLHKSCIDVSLYVFSEETMTDALSTLTDELKKCVKMLNVNFTSMKNIICKKDMEIKSLQENLNEIKSKMGTSQNKQTEDFQSLQNKCTLLRLNGHRLEKKHKKLLETCERMEDSIKKLEKEKAELEKEAAELAEELRKQNTSDDLRETCIMLSKTTKELRQLKDENKFLKSDLKQCEALLKKQNISLSGICNVGVRDKAANVEDHAARSSLKQSSSSYSYDV